MNIISNILYWISTGLLVPVIVLLIFFFIRAIILIGTFFGQYLQVKKHSESFYARIVKLTPATLDSFSEALPEKSDTVVTAYAKKIIASHDTTHASTCCSRSMRSRPTRNCRLQKCSQRWVRFSD